MSNSPPQTASKLYKNLHKTALAFISAQSQSPTHQSRMDINLLTSLTTSSFQHTFGHTYAVSRAPPLQGEFDMQRFTQHLGGMVPNLDSWETSVTDVVVDEVRRKVMLRVKYDMRVKGVEEGLENDIVWVLEMDEEGEKVKVSTEFVDGVAAGRLKEIIMGRKG